MSVITHLPTSYDLLAARIYGVGLYAFRQAVRLCGLSKAVSWHNCRHRFANELLWRGCDIRTVQTLLGHADVRTPQIATHVLGQGFAGVQSPLG
ncbi:tyrosine-type recombinase/integrase [Pseudomonas sp. 5P_3.1_Bac2]|uniref:tyrosine-type recombinase/integrase n=1 Tax=Pseudomonas sp. 5P_3.1_Bac2 TaxID=2971617 RepID=UPI0021C91FC1|nr:tyrosine-type recombinase/integrase [Pseudomonas sp. 5P_3.1_Bac2]MCU1716440.1 tyrosine-type recombinase/integrase [Pseudomonas sp. 5P_3.1_Bac2]